MHIPKHASSSRGKSYITLQRLVIEALPRQELTTDYNSLSATEIPKIVDWYNDIMRYNWLPGFSRSVDGQTAITTRFETFTPTARIAQGSEPPMYAGGETIR